MKDKFETVKWFIRYRLLSYRYWGQFYYTQLKTRIFPDNKWATKDIPRTFTDVDYIFETVLFNGLMFWWDKDGGEVTIRSQFEGNYDSASFDSAIALKERKKTFKKMYEELKAAYIWATIRGRAYEEAGFDWKLEEAHRATDTIHLTNIVKYRNSMWT